MDIRNGRSSEKKMSLGVTHCSNTLNRCPTAGVFCTVTVVLASESKALLKRGFEYSQRDYTGLV